MVKNILILNMSIFISSSDKQTNTTEKAVFCNRVMANSRTDGIDGALANLQTTELTESIYLMELMEPMESREPMESL